MTDLPPPSRLPEPSGDEADLLASLYLDDEATPEERARVEADPALMERVEMFRTIATENAAVIPPAGLAELQIGAALDVFDAVRSSEVAASTPTEHRAAPVTSLTERRSRRSALPTWLGAAAVSALVIGGLGFVATRGGGDDEVASIERSAPASASSTGEGQAADTAASDAPQADLADGEELAEAADADDTMMDAAEAEVAGDDTGGDDSAGDAADEGATGRPPFTPEEAAEFYLENGPVDLADFEGTIAADYYEQLLDLPLQPLEMSPCADSPLIAGLLGVDSFLPVILDRQQASLVVQAGSPATALIVGPTCEIALP